MVFRITVLFRIFNKRNIYTGTELNEPIVVPGRIIIVFAIDIVSGNRIHTFFLYYDCILCIGAIGCKS